MLENLVMTSAYACSSTRTLSRVRGRILSRVGKVVSDNDVAFRFGAKFKTLLGATNGVARVIIETEVICVRLTIKFPFCLSRFLSHFRNKQVPFPSPVKF